ncbi:MAG: S8 family serine peptidase, partial [Anaerolineae bacterium]|nr:S8 family serine peptidase [Anaerolineae bacterium]
MSRTRSSLAMVALLAVLMLLSVALPVAAQDGAGRIINVEGEAPQAPTTRSVSPEINTSAMRRPDGTVSVIVKLAGEPAYTEFIAAGGRANRAAANARANDRAAVLRAEQANFIGAAQALGGRVTGSFQFLNNAVVVDIAPERVLGLANVPGVVAIGPNRLYERTHTTSMPLVRASDVWEGSYTGGSFTGEGVTVAVIDEGIDYTHAHFGGEQNYEDNDPTVLSDVVWPPVGLPSAMGEQLVIGGTDYVGDDYGTNDDYTIVPDPDPVGCPYSHGTHVAGTIAGYGVTAAGDTFTGDLTDGDALFPSYPAPSLGAFRIGPGAAPRANLVSLKVFGCDGATGTDVLLMALEDAASETYLDEDVDVVNMSLGSSYGGTGPDDFLNGAQQALAEIGVVVVASAGNSGDIYLVHGAPSSAPTTISVASILDNGVVTFGALTYVDPNTSATVTTPAVPGQMYEAGLPDPLTANVVMADVANGCSALTGTYTGQWVIVDRGVCGFSIKVANVKAAGGAGTIIANNVPGAPGIAGRTAGFDDVLPTVMISQSAGVALKAAISSATVSATYDSNNTVASTESPLVPSTFTSRGGVLRGNSDGILKPNIAAPGNTITSAGAGTNNIGYTQNGTSMSSPHIAGGAALLIEALGKPTDLAGASLIKQRLMNTATTDLFATSTVAAPYHSPQRIGAGFADYVAAINTDLVAYATDAPENVSLSFGYPRQLTGQPLIVSKTITLSNLSASAMTLNTAYSPRSDWVGAFVTVNPAVVTVPANSTATVTVTLTVVADLSNSNVSGDPLFSTAGKTILHEESGYVTFTPITGSQTPIRVAVYAAPDLTSNITAGSEVQLVGGNVGSSQVNLSGTGFAYAGNVLSLTSAYQLLAEDGEETGLFWDADENGTEDGDEELSDYAAADLQYVGAQLIEEVNVDSTGATYSEQILYVGVKTYGEWTHTRDTRFLVEVDIDNDGDKDLFLANEDGNLLYKNNGKGYFTDCSTTHLPQQNDLETRKIAVNDVDRDGDLDIFLANVNFLGTKNPQHRLYINNGKGKFTDETNSRLPKDEDHTIDAIFED